MINARISQNLLLRNFSFQIRFAHFKGQKSIFVSEADVFSSFVFVKSKKLFNPIFWKYWLNNVLRLQQLFSVPPQKSVFQKNGCFAGIFSNTTLKATNFWVFLFWKSFPSQFQKKKVQKFRRWRSPLFLNIWYYTFIDAKFNKNKLLPWVENFFGTRNFKKYFEQFFFCLFSKFPFFLRKNLK